MDMTNREYGAYVKAKAGRSPLWKDLMGLFGGRADLCRRAGTAAVLYEPGYGCGCRRRRGIHYLDLFGGSSDRTGDL